MTIKMWDLPKEGLKDHMNDCVVTLKGHQKSVTGLAWHKIANNTLASCS